MATSISWTPSASYSGSTIPSQSSQRATDGLAAVVLDLHMPLLDGVAAAARLRREDPNPCLLAVTADPDQALHDSATEAGADAVLPKDALVDGLLEQLHAGHVATPAV